MAVVAPRLKICCISSRAEAELAVSFGASALGLVSDMPSGPGVIPEPLIAEIANSVPPGVATVLLTCQSEAEAIIEQQRRCLVNTLQLVDEVLPDVRLIVRRALPGIKIIQVVHVTGPEAVEAAARAVEGADALLLDSGDPRLTVKELGGTARVHDWELGRRIVDQSPKPVFLAGGLTSANVAEAVARVKPFGLDVCSGVRTNGALDPKKLGEYVVAVASAGRRRSR